MKHIKTALLVGAGVTTISLGGLGIASAATTGTSAEGETSLAAKIATRFHLNKSEVESVVDQDRAEHMTEMKTQRAEALKQAVTDGKLTQARADHITAVWNEIETLRDGKRPDQLSSTTRAAIQTKIDDLHTWAKSQGIDLPSIGGMGMMHGHGGMRHGSDMDADDSTGSST